MFLFARRFDILETAQRTCQFSGGPGGDWESAICLRLMSRLYSENVPGNAMERSMGQGWNAPDLDGVEWHAPSRARSRMLRGLRSRRAPRWVRAIAEALPVRGSDGGSFHETSPRPSSHPLLASGFNEGGRETFAGREMAGVQHRRNDPDPSLRFGRTRISTTEDGRSRPMAASLLTQ